MKEYSLKFGALAPHMSDQLPMLTLEQAERFDADNKAAARLRVRGYLTEQELLKVHRRLAAQIGDAIAAAAKEKE